MKLRIAIICTGCAVTFIYGLTAIVIPILALRDMNPSYLRVAAPIIMLLSPLALIITLAGLIGSLGWKQHPVARWICGVLAFIGILITGYFTLGMFALWKMGPINPG